MNQYICQRRVSQIFLASWVENSTEYNLLSTNTILYTLLNTLKIHFLTDLYCIYPIATNKYCVWLLTSPPCRSGQCHHDVRENRTSLPVSEYDGAMDKLTLVTKINYTLLLLTDECRQAILSVRISCRKKTQYDCLYHPMRRCEWS